LGSLNYKDASPTGLKIGKQKNLTMTNEKEFVEESKAQKATKPQTAPFAS